MRQQPLCHLKKRNFSEAVYTWSIHFLFLVKQSKESSAAIRTLVRSESLSIFFKWQREISFDRIPGIFGLKYYPYINRQIWIQTSKNIYSSGNVYGQLTQKLI